LRFRHNVVIDEDNELPDRNVDAGIAGGCGPLISLRQPPQPHGRAERFQIGIGTVC
jgi:hypothetical protein